MAVWKSREGKDPPSNWYAQLIGHLVQSYPAAQLDAAELTAQLQPAVVNISTRQRVPLGMIACTGESVWTMPPRPITARARPRA